MIVGDANLCEVATFLKVGTTAIVLAMIEDGFIDKDLSISSPVAAMRTVSHDPTCRATVELAELGRCTAVELQWEFLRLGAQVRRRDRPRVAAAARSSATQVLDRWEAVLGALESDPSSLDGQLDWVTKLELLRAYVDRDGLEWSDPKLALLDLQYHDVRPDRSLYERLVRAGKVERLVPRTDVYRSDGRSARRRPGRISGARASHAGPTRWSPRTGTASSSTSERDPAAKDPDDGAHAW